MIQRDRAWEKETDSFVHPANHSFIGFYITEDVGLLVEGGLGYISQDGLGYAAVTSNPHLCVLLQERVISPRLPVCHRLPTALVHISLTLGPT